MAQAVVFLASDESSFFNQADFVVDHGITAGMPISGEIPGAQR